MESLHPLCAPKLGLLALTLAVNKGVLLHLGSAPRPLDLSQVPLALLCLVPPTLLPTRHSHAGPARLKTSLGWRWGGRLLQELLGGI